MPTEDAWDEMTKHPAETPVESPQPRVVKEATPTVTEAPPENPPGAGRPASSVLRTGNETEEELAAAKLPTRKFKVETPRISFRWHGVEVTDEFTPVPDQFIAGMLTAARDVGVELTEEGV
jgi:hypothetical protein